MSQPETRPDQATQDGATVTVTASRRQGHTITRPLRRNAQRVGAWLSRLPLFGALALSLLSLLVTGFFVLLITNRFGGNHHWKLGVEHMGWSERLKYAAATVTAFGATVALVVNYRKQRDSEQGRFASNFADACAQLGGEAPAVRLGGVYALAALADRQSNHERRQQCIDALCAYLRLPYTPPTGNDHTATRTIEAIGPAGEKITTASVYRIGDHEVRLTIIRIIRDHLINPDAKNNWIGVRLDFTGAVFDGGDFEGARFAGDTSFKYAVFSGGDVLFRSAVFSANKLSFKGAKFLGRRVSFAGAEFLSGEVSFESAVFSGGRVSFESAVFSGGQVWFHHAEFFGGLVSFGQATFLSGTVSFGGARFSGGEMQFFLADFCGGTVSFGEARFSAGSVSFDSATFRDSVVWFLQSKFLAGSSVSFPESTFSGGSVRFNGAEFRGGLVSFSEAEFLGGSVLFLGAELWDGEISFNDSQFFGGSVSFIAAKRLGGRVVRGDIPFGGWLSRAAGSDF